MASLVIGVVGAAVGGFFGGPAGAAIGWSLGSAAGGLLFPNKPAQVPHDLHIQGSSYGAFRKIIYGTVRISGNVIWETDLQEHDGGGKGKTPQQQTFTASFDVGLCETPVVSVTRFWAAGRLNYDINQPDGPTIPFVLYDGNATQLPDPTEEATEGVGNVPAYRGVSRVVFSDWDMTQFGNSIPQLSFELQTKTFGGALAIVQSNYTETPVSTDFQVIFDWPVTGDITIGQETFSSSFTAASNTGSPQIYQDDFTYVGPDMSPTFTWPVRVGNTLYYAGLGNYVHSDLSAHPLWFQYVYDYPCSADSLRQPIVTTFGTQVTSGGHPYVQDSTVFLHTAGVPDGEYVHAMALTSDSTKLFVFTSPTSGVTISPVTKWYRIEDGLVVANGTVSPPVILNCFGILGVNNSGSPPVNSVANFENNGRWMWHYNNPSGAVKVYHIDDAGNFADSGLGSITIPAFSPVASSVKAIGTGFCGFVRNTALVKLSRLGALQLTYLDEVVADRCDSAGLDPSQYDVTQLANIVVDGYVIESQITNRAAIETLMPVYFFDAVESDGVVKFVVRGSAPIVTFADDDLAAHMDGDNLPSILSCVHTQDADLPSAISISYMNKSADYQINTQTWQRMTGGGRDVQTVQVPLVLTDDHAKKIVDAWGFNTIWERDTYTWYSSRKYAKYEPTDVCIVQGITIRITSKNEGATGVIKWEGVPSRAANYVQAGASGAAFAPGQTLNPTVATQLVLLDIPMRQDSDNQNGLYAAMAGASIGSWTGGSLFKSSDGGSTYAAVATAVAPATIGTVTEALGNFPGGNTFDESHAVTVTISAAGGGTLASETDLAVLNGANRFLIGNEIVQAKNCVLTAPSTYVLSGFLRGRRGTEAEIPLHVAGETFIDLSTVVDVDAPFSDLGQERFYKAVTFGQSLASASPVSFVNYGAKLRPYSPSQLGGGCDASGNVTINWHRRTRLGWAWVDFTDVLLGESTEGYVLQIWDNHFQHVARIVNLTSPTFVYTSAMQVTDFGSQQQTIFVSVGQVGSYLLGQQTTAEIPGAGGSNTSIVAPVTPYNNPPPTTGTGCTGTVVADTLNWATPTYIFSPDGFGGAQTWLLSFTTGSVTAGRGKVMAFAGSGDQLVMGGKLTSEPCGQPLPPSTLRLPLSSLVQFSFYMTGNPNPGSIPTLLPSTTYYLCVTRPSVGAAMTAILYSPGN